MTKLGRTIRGIDFRPETFLTIQLPWLDDVYLLQKGNNSDDSSSGSSKSFHSEDEDMPEQKMFMLLSLNQRFLKDLLKLAH